MSGPVSRGRRSGRGAGSSPVRRLADAAEGLQTGSLFRERVEAAEAGDLPLAARIRPRTLDEFVGQEHLLAPGKPLRVAIERDELHSCIFWGPAGCGKSTLAFIIAGATKAQFAPYSAVSSGVADMRKVIAQATRRRSIYGQRTILFVDEIHRFNKAQQDAFLPFVENGTIILVGSTTENPFFEINSPLISRCRLYTFERLTPDQISAILLRALEDGERGLGKMKLSLDQDALAHMAKMSEGDARVGLNALEVAGSLVGERGHITLGVAEQALQRRAIEYDKDADSHYDTISAFIKSLRGSNPDAALHYLARMLKAGEDPRFIARRLVVHASEDVGNADPMALVVATSAAHAVEYVGLPEARLALAQATIYIATAPKSNTTYAALDRAMEDVEKRGAEPVPKHLRDSNYPGAARMGHGEGYLYPHSFPGAYVPQEYMPPGVKSRPYYEPSERGYEAEIRRRMKEWRAASRQEDAGSVEPPRAAESPEETERKATPGE